LLKMLSSHGTALGRKTKDDDVCGEDNGRKTSWTAVHSPEVHHFASRAWNHGTKFKPDTEPMNEGKKPATRSNRDALIEPTDPKVFEGG
jgi:hypothetical protein